MAKRREECFLFICLKKGTSPQFLKFHQENTTFNNVIGITEKKCWALHTKAIYCSFKTRYLNQWHSPPKPLQQNIASIDVILSSPIMVYMVGGIVSTVTTAPPLE